MPCHSSMAIKQLLHYALELPILLNKQTLHKTNKVTGGRTMAKCSVLLLQFFSSSSVLQLSSFSSFSGGRTTFKMFGHAGLPSLQSELLINDQTQTAAIYLRLFRGGAMPKFCSWSRSFLLFVSQINRFN